MQVQGKYDARVFLGEQMTRAQGLRLKRLSEEAYQPPWVGQNPPGMVT
ncbi:hypothetical protein ACVIHA_007794 [Bradyrhizobium liaoningense]